jgi:hypothetical protein
VAKECLKVCGLILLLIPALFARFLIIRNTITLEMGLPRIFKNTKSSFPGLKAI